MNDNAPRTIRSHGSIYYHPNYMNYVRKRARVAWHDGFFAGLFVAVGGLVVGWLVVALFTKFFN